MWTKATNPGLEFSTISLSGNIALPGISLNMSNPFFIPHPGFWSLISVSVYPSCPVHLVFIPDPGFEPSLSVSLENFTSLKFHKGISTNTLFITGTRKDNTNYEFLVLSCVHTCTLFWFMRSQKILLLAKNQNLVSNTAYLYERYEKFRV